MFEGDAGIEDGYFDSFALGFFPEGWDAEEFDAPVDCLGCGQHDLVDLEGWEPINRPAHIAITAGKGSEVGSDPSQRAERSGGSPISDKTGKPRQINDNLAECKLWRAFFGSFLVSLSIESKKTLSGWP